MPYLSVIEFWFEEITPAQWWQKNDDFDALIDEKFADLHQAATRCELFAWRRRPLGRLAEIIVLDQFSRNIEDSLQSFCPGHRRVALGRCPNFPIWPELWS